MIEDRYAALLRDVSNIEVVVTRDRDNVIDKSHMPFQMKPSKKVLGIIAFTNSASPSTIIDEFTNTYLGWAERYNSNNWSMADYPSSFESVLSRAFVQYFSKR